MARDLQLHNLKFKRCTSPEIAALLLTAPLAGAAFRANAAGAGPDDFVTAADGTGDAHENAAERYCYAVRVFVAVPVRFSGRPPFADWMDDS